MRHVVVVWDGLKGLPLSLLGTLAIRNVQERQGVALLCDGGTNAAIHSTADQDDREFVGCGRRGHVDGE